MMLCVHEIHRLVSQHIGQPFVAQAFTQVRVSRIKLVLDGYPMVLALPKGFTGSLVAAWPGERQESSEKCSSYAKGVHLTIWLHACLSAWPGNGCVRLPVRVSWHDSRYCAFNLRPCVGRRRLKTSHTPCTQHFVCAESGGLRALATWGRCLSVNAWSCVFMCYVIFVHLELAHCLLVLRPAR